MPAALFSSRVFQRDLLSRAGRDLAFFAARWVSDENVTTLFGLQSDIVKTVFFITVLLGSADVRMAVHRPVRSGCAIRC